MCCVIRIFKFEISAPICDQALVCAAAVTGPAVTVTATVTGRLAVDCVRRRLCATVARNKSLPVDAGPRPTPANPALGTRTPSRPSASQAAPAPSAPATMRNTLSNGPDVIPVTELGAVARRITFSSAATPGALLPPALAVTSRASCSGAVAEPIAVVLRVRPLSSAERCDGPAAVRPDPERPGVVHVIPRNIAVHNACIRANERATFRFGSVFDESVGQAQLFRDTTAPLVEALFQGTNGLVFAYGTSNAGKTYTIQGEPAEPGILPRSLDVIFNSIAAAKAGDRKEANGTETVSASVAALVKDEDQLVGEGEGSEERGDGEGDDPRSRPDVFGSDRSREDLTLQVSPEPEYEVTVSYLEIYNEQCFDLLVRPKGAGRAMAKAKAKPVDQTADPAQSTLKERYEPPPIASVRPVKRTVLKLKENRTLGEVYAEGLREVTVSSVADVQRLLSFGQRNRSVAETGVNAHSSRSHTIFCIKLTQRIALAKKRGAGRQAGCHITTSKLSIVDLAGNERSSRTGVVGQRLKEASLINTSLMNLGHCLEAMRQNQKAAAAAAEAAIIKADGGGSRPGLAPIDGNVVAAQGNRPRRVAEGKTVTRQASRGNRPAAGGGLKATKVSAKVTVPFRQSRLTRLFQHQLETGNAVMIANVSPAICDADETIHSLRRAAIAREVSTISVANRPRTVVPDTSRLVSPSMLRDVEKKYETKATADLEKIAALEADNALLRNKVEEHQLEFEADKAALEDDRLELEKELDEVCRKNEMLQDKLADCEGKCAAKECEIRQEITAATEKILTERDERHRAALAISFAEGEAAAEARVNNVTQTARKERLQLTERQRRRDEKECRADARRLSLAVNLSSMFAEEDDEDSSKDGDDQDAEAQPRALTLDDLELDEEDYEYEEEDDEEEFEEEEFEEQKDMADEPEGDEEVDGDEEAVGVKVKPSVGDDLVGDVNLDLDLYEEDNDYEEEDEEEFEEEYYEYEEEDEEEVDRDEEALGEKVEPSVGDGIDGDVDLEAVADQLGELAVECSGPSRGIAKNERAVAIARAISEVLDGNCDENDARLPRAGKLEATAVKAEDGSSGGSTDSNGPWLRQLPMRSARRRR